MRRMMFIAFISLFLVIFSVFIIKWGLHGSDFVWSYQEQINSFMSIVYAPCKSIGNNIMVLSSHSFNVDSVLTAIKIIMQCIILPFQIGGLFLLWLFS